MTPVSCEWDRVPHLQCKILFMGIPLPSWMESNHDVSACRNRMAFGATQSTRKTQCCILLPRSLAFELRDHNLCIFRFSIRAVAKCVAQKPRETRGSQLVDWRRQAGMRGRNSHREIGVRTRCCSLKQGQVDVGSSSGGVAVRHFYDDEFPTRAAQMSNNVPMPQPILRERDGHLLGERGFL